MPKLDSIPLNPVATQVFRPMNPHAGGEFHNPISFAPVFDRPKLVKGSLHEAIRAANKLVLKTPSGRDAMGVLQAGEGAFALLKLSSGNALSNEPVVFDAFRSSDPLGGPVTDRFERTAAGKDLAAIVGARTVATWLTDGTSKIEPIGAAKRP